MTISSELLIGVLVSLYGAIIGAYLYINAKVSRMQEGIKGIADKVEQQANTLSSETLTWRTDLVQRLTRMESGANETVMWRKDLIERLGRIEGVLLGISERKGNE